MTTTAWETFLRIDRQATSDNPPVADAEWLRSKAIEPGAPIVLGHLRRDVLPFVRELEREGTLEWYSFLVHGYRSGVPTTPEDASSYVHLRFRSSGAQHLTPPGWLWTRNCELGEIAGLSAIDTAQAWRLIGEQSKLFLDFLAQYGPEVDDLVVLKELRQFMHFFANMSQMVVS
jgi:hypothetical protein